VLSTFNKTIRIDCFDLCLYHMLYWLRVSAVKERHVSVSQLQLKHHRVHAKSDRLKLQTAQFPRDKNKLATGKPCDFTVEL
jgi:hypothetical protein